MTEPSTSVDLPIADHEADSDRPLRWMMGAAVMLTLLVLGLYLLTFARSSGLSSKVEDWSRFGDYLGGTLGPAVALFALWGIFHAIKLQRRELRLSVQELARSSEALQQQMAHLRAERKITDLRSAVGHIETEIDLLLSVSVSTATLRESITDQFDMASGWRLRDLITVRQWFNQGKIGAESPLWTVTQSAIQVCIRMEYLARLLYQLETEFKQPHFVSAVKSKYNPVTAKLSEKNYLRGATGPYLMQVEDLPEVAILDGVPVKLYSP